MILTGRSSGLCIDPGGNLPFRNLHCIHERRRISTSVTIQTGWNLHLNEVSVGVGRFITTRQYLSYHPSC